MMVVPDQTQKVVYETAVRDNLKDGDMLMFAHGFNIHYNQIIPPAGVDVTMIAPEGPGPPGPPGLHRGRRACRRSWPSTRTPPVKARRSGARLRQGHRRLCGPA